MAGNVNRFKIGLFVVVGFFLGASILIWLGASRIFESTQTVAAYFAESVQGLERDSPVKFRGVTVGRVSAVRMAPDFKLIEVVMSLDEKFRVSEDMGVKITLLGLTGQKYLEMDRFAGSERHDPPRLEFQPKHRVIATYPSDMREIGNALDNVFRKVNAVDLVAISNNLLNVTARLDAMLADPRVGRIGVDAAETVNEIKSAARRVNESMEKIQPTKKVSKVLDNTNDFLQEIITTTRNVDRFVRRSDQNLNLLSQKLDRSADNLIEFTRIIRNKPSSFIFGPPEEKPKKKP
ncbi:MAG: MlaD family protein [Pseudomonadota bacterium]